MTRRIGLACLLALVVSTVLSLPARAVSGSADYSALWYNAGESGWGMNVMQQEQILFITLFLYGNGNAPTWLVASNVTFVSENSAGDRTYTGALYATTGTPFGVTPFNPAATTVRQVGSITFVGRADGTATVQYTADTASVSKTLVRQTWAQPNFTLNTATPYAASSADTTSGCAIASENGRFNGTMEQVALYIHSNTMRMEVTGDVGLCVLQGNDYIQEGRYGKAVLTGTCSGLPPSTPALRLAVREVEVGSTYFTLQFTQTGGPFAGCTSVGTMTGTKK